MIIKFQLQQKTQMLVIANGRIFLLIGWLKGGISILLFNYL